MSECIEHTKNRDKDGYGRISAKVGLHKYTMLRAHRVAYCEHHGLQLSDIDGKVVRHRCDNPSCVNPDHLELGTIQDNNRDRHVRGRDARGERHGLSKLSDWQVAEIKRRYKRGCRVNGASALAREFGVDDCHVGRVARGERRG